MSPDSITPRAIATRRHADCCQPRHTHACTRRPELLRGTVTVSHRRRFAVATHDPSCTNSKAERAPDDHLGHPATAPPVVPKDCTACLHRKQARPESLMVTCSYFSWRLSFSTMPRRIRWSRAYLSLGGPATPQSSSLEAVPPSLGKVPLSKPAHKQQAADDTYDPSP